MNVLPKRLLELRKEKKLKQSDLSDYLNVGRTTYTGYEKGSATPSIDSIIKLAEFYNVTTDYLLGRTNLKLSINQMTLLSDIELTNEEIFKKHTLTIEGEKLTSNEFIKAIELIRALK